MGIRVITKTNKPAALKLYNHINTFLFEQAFDELKSDSSKVRKTLYEAKLALAELIKKSS